VMSDWGQWSFILHLFNIWDYPPQSNY
jgi:hypothetical protein